MTQGEPLLAFLLGALELKRSAVKNSLKFGAVSVNGETIRQFDHALSPGDVVTVCNLQAAAATGRLERAQIQPVYEDDDLIVVDKPSGLLTVATERETTDTLYVRLNGYLRDRQPAQPQRALVVHRLDQETSGLVLFAKNESSKRLLQDAWPAVEKIYFAVVQGRPNAESGTVTNYLVEEGKSLNVYGSNHPLARSRPATTHYRLLKSSGRFSLMEVRLGTGRKHQIRVHLAGLGCPVAGDRRYGRGLATCPRLALHAGGLLLAHPTTGEPLSFTSPLPRAMRQLVP